MAGDARSIQLKRAFFPSGLIPDHVANGFKRRHPPVTPALLVTGAGRRWRILLVEPHPPRKTFWRFARHIQLIYLCLNVCIA